MDTLSITLSAILQILLFSLIPFLAWFFTARKTIGFFNWIGLKKPEISNKKTFALWIAICMLTFAGIWLVAPLIDRDLTAMAQFAGQGPRLLLGGLVWGMIQTGLSEEIFFRGFVGKRLINLLGFARGNLIQASIFGLLHLVMMFPAVGLAIAMILAFVTGFMGWVMGYVNEKLANGSILPSWIIHGFGNTLAAVLVMFNSI